MRKGSRNILIATLISMIATYSGTAFSLEDSESTRMLRKELSAKHTELSRESLLALIGSEDKLVLSLIALRREQKPPVLGARAEKLLLTFSEREDVQKALLADVDDPNAFGLASIILSSLPNIKSTDFRKTLVNKALNQKSSLEHQERYREILKSLPDNTLK